MYGTWCTYINIYIYRYILLMVQKSGKHQLRLVGFPIIHKVLYIQTVVVWDFWTINSSEIKTYEPQVVKKISSIERNKSKNPRCHCCKMATRLLEHHEQIQLVSIWPFPCPRFHVRSNDVLVFSGQMSSVNQTLMTFHYTGWLMGILILIYHSPYITG